MINKGNFNYLTEFEMPHLDQMIQVDNQFMNVSSRLNNFTAAYFNKELQEILAYGFMYYFKIDSQRV